MFNNTDCPDIFMINSLYVYIGITLYIILMKLPGYKKKNVNFTNKIVERTSVYLLTDLYTRQIKNVCCIYINRLHVLEYFLNCFLVRL